MIQPNHILFIFSENSQYIINFFHMDHIQKAKKRYIFKSVDFAELLITMESFINFDTCQLICYIPPSFPLLELTITVQNIDFHKNCNLHVLMGI